MTVTHKGIIIHCTATQPHWMERNTVQDKLMEIDRWHRDRGFNMVGYHAIVDRDGSIAYGRPYGTMGAHAKGYNDWIGIALVGGHGSDADDVASEHYTPVQLNALYEMIKELQERYSFKPSQVIGHNKTSNKACPGFRAAKWFAGEEVARNRTAPERSKPTQSKTVKASAATVAASAGSAVASLSSLDSTAQYIVLGFAGLTVLLGVYIMKERLKAWANGWR